jgi:3'-phosphoadenosine 5'-phosphosulfate sulfotransferase (PAPS reductase)/FAD synthetase
VNTVELWQLKQMQSLPLETKIIKSQQRIREWYEHWDGNVYVSFSGGKDSTVLLHLVSFATPV